MLEYGSQSPIGSELFSRFIPFTTVLLMSVCSSSGEVAARPDD